MRQHRCAGGRDVIIANHAEFNRRWMQGFRAADFWPWDSGADALFDQCLFWGGNRPKTIVTNFSPDERYVEDVKAALGGAEIEIITVGWGRPFVSRAACSDETLIDLLARRLNEGGGGRLLAWGLTPGVFALIRALEMRGAEFEAPELPEADFMAEARVINSKAGARKLLTRHGVKMAEGVVVSSLGEAADAAAHFARTGQGAVVKANNGSGGFAVRAYRAEKLLGRPEYALRDLELRARLDGAWRSPLLVVERLIEAAPGAAPCSPTTDWLVRGDSTSAHLGTGVMTIRHQTLYSGVTAGVGAMEPSMRDECERTGAKVASVLAGEGFRGWFDVDMVTDGGGGVYVTEVNLRRTCPAHAFEFAGFLLGADWMGKGCVTTVERLDLGRSGAAPDYGIVRSVIALFNQECGPESAFAVATGVTNCLTRHRPELGLAVVERDGEAATVAAGKLADRLRRSLGE